MSQVNTTFEYNGAAFEFDIRDADNAELFEKALNVLKEDEKTSAKDGKASDAIRAQCSMVKKFFDTIFGDCAGTKICGEKSNIAVCYDAYEKFLFVVREQKNDMISYKNSFMKYSNRSQRRGFQHGKKPSK